MSDEKSVYEGIMQGLKEAQDYVDGKDTGARVTKRSRKNFRPAIEYTASDIKRIRTDSCLTQPELGALFGVSSDTIKNWEQGINRISGGNARMLELLSEDNQVMVEKFIQKTS